MIQRLIEKHAPLLVMLAFAGETLMFTFFRGKAGIWLSPMLTGIFSAGIALIPLINPKPWKLRNTEGLKASKSNILLIWIAGVLLTAQLMNGIIIQYPLDVNNSDIIPTLQELYVSRFLEGLPVYAEGDCQGIPCTPNYLPLQWLPFIIAEILNLDYRWIGMIAIWLSIAGLYYVLHKTALCGWQGISRMFLPFVLLALWMYQHPEGFGYTVETLNVAWYMLLGLSFYFRGSTIRVLGILGTVLSRYLLIFWLPAYAWMEKKRSPIRFRKIVTLSFMGILALYIIPFLFQDPGAFWRGFQSYPIAALGEWKGQSWQETGDNPYQLFQGLGLASWFYTLAPGDLDFKFTLSRYAHLLASLLGLILAFRIQKKYRGKVSDELLLLTGLKIYMTLFFSFLIVPYVYLHLIPSFFSLLIVLRYFNGNKFKNVFKIKYKGILSQS